MDTRLKILADERISRLLGFSSSIAAYGVAAIRGIFVLNGSAAVAILTKQEFLTAEGKDIIWFCAIGAGLAVFCAGTSFLAQWCKKEVYAQDSADGLLQYIRTGLSKPLGKARYERRARIAFWVSAALFCASVTCFCHAVYKLISIL